MSATETGQLLLAHHPGPDELVGHQEAFHEATVVRGEQASDYFRRSGIGALAEANGGICTFRFGAEVAVYQLTNDPMVNEAVLAPSTAANSELFGDFMGSLDNAHPDRPAKRAAVERSLGNGRFVDDLEPEIRRHAAAFLGSATERTWPLDEFALQLVAYVDSQLPGVLDLRQRPLTEYLAMPEYAEVVRSFFDIASEVISKKNDVALRELEAIERFVRDLLLDNLECLATASDANMIVRHLALWETPLTRAGISALNGAQLKELATLIVATFDTTALSLLWLLCFLETAPAHRDAALAGGTGEPGGRLSTLDLAVLEAVRLAGSNPTALWRRTTVPFLLQHQGRQAELPAGTMIWLDRRGANQDPTAFPNPECFDPANIRAIMRSERETVSSMLSRNRYEINSFSMINSERNPRKCPGRLFSVRIQSIVADELYRHYRVTVEGVDTRLRAYSSMPRPVAPGTIRISPHHLPQKGNE
ncbi:cytochrome P450 [Kitasatospora sp. MAP5-34]|uniref:cytochrome P450 n=1 Tax=Kitasatospora sp. MAP5-34 TaxID=3035102 RepID=UPI002476F452|nr:cytochrome P450 [Kitasatospora sp. MAP5-34]MDH6575311.1 cytochrome P450 [Kitasatospora sp. MAP5-34]